MCYACAERFVFVLLKEGALFNRRRGAKSGGVAKHLQWVRRNPSPRYQGVVASTRVPGDDHPNTLTSASDLAFPFKQGKYCQSRGVVSQDAPVYCTRVY